jgi:hypothetical protein
MNPGRIRFTFTAEEVERADIGRFLALFGAASPDARGWRLLCGEVRLHYPVGLREAHDQPWQCPGFTAFARRMLTEATHLPYLLSREESDLMALILGSLQDLKLLRREISRHKETLSLSYTSSEMASRRQQLADHFELSLQAGRFTAMEKRKLRLALKRYLTRGGFDLLPVW